MNMKVWAIMVDGELDSVQDNKQSCIEKLCFWGYEREDAEATVNTGYGCEWFKTEIRVEETEIEHFC